MPSIPIHDVNVGGLYLGPSFKITLNAMLMAVTVRSEFFLRGDLGNRTLIGIELGAP